MRIFFAVVLLLGSLVGQFTPSVIYLPQLGDPVADEVLRVNPLTPPRIGSWMYVEANFQPPYCRFSPNSTLRQTQWPWVISGHHLVYGTTFVAVPVQNGYQFSYWHVGDIFHTQYFYPGNWATVQRVWLPDDTRLLGVQFYVQAVTGHCWEFMGSRTAVIRIGN